MGKIALNILFPLLLIACNVIACRSTSPAVLSGDPSEIELVQSFPDRPTGLTSITCMECSLTHANPEMASFFKELQPIDAGLPSIFNKVGTVYYGFKYTLDHDHLALVFGHDAYEGGIDFYLVIWNKQTHKFVSKPTLIAGSQGDGQEQYHTESTLEDVNGDGHLDVVTSYFTIFQEFEPNEIAYEILEISIYKKGAFETVSPSEEQWMHYKTKTFSLPERKFGIQAVATEDLYAYCDAENNSSECLISVHDELYRRIENARSNPYVQKTWINYKNEEFKFIEHLMDEDGTMYPILILKYESSVLQYRILELTQGKAQTSLKDLKMALIQAQEENNTAYNEVIARERMEEKLKGLFLAADNTWQAYRDEALKALEKEDEAQLLHKKLLLLKNRTALLLTYRNYLSTME